jgi:hypothetical protein
MCLFLTHGADYYYMVAYGMCTEQPQLGSDRLVYTFDPAVEFYGTSWGSDWDERSSHVYNLLDNVIVLLDTVNGASFLQSFDLSSVLPFVCCIVTHTHTLSLSLSLSFSSSVSA